MIDRIVENWLTNTNEIGYQIPFCQYLMTSNFTILHISTHGQMEQGKDIITLDENEKPCAFQLKSGTINVTIWRKIKGEIDELVEIPINYPSINKDIPHRAVLVTNGRITDPVRRGIDDLNLSYKNRGFSELELITGSDLLKRFIGVHGSFLPTDLSDFKIFLELILSDGHELLDKKQMSVFLESILFTPSRNKSEFKRKIASSVLLTQYVLQPYESTNNHISIIEGWSMLCGYILSLVEKTEMKEKYWRKSFDLILEKINSQLERLKDEFLSRTELTEGAWDGGLIYKSRILMVLGWLSALELYKKQIDTNYNIDERVYGSIKKHYGKRFWFWGESATPLFVMMSLLTWELGDTILSDKIIWDVINVITFGNDLRRVEGIPDPYFSPKEILGDLYQISNTKIDKDTFVGSSYHLGLLVDILVRRKKRQILDNLWKLIFPIQKCEFKPKPSWKMLIWDCHEGQQIENFYKTPQSWKELRDEAINFDNSDMPKVLCDNPFSYYFLICYPHRLTRSTIKLINRVYTP